MSCFERRTVGGERRVCVLPPSHEGPCRWETSSFPTAQIETWIDLDAWDAALEAAPTAPIEGTFIASIGVAFQAAFSEAIRELAQRIEEYTTPYEVRLIGEAREALSVAGFPVEHADTVAEICLAIGLQPIDVVVAMVSGRNRWAGLVSPDGDPVDLPAGRGFDSYYQDQDYERDGTDGGAGASIDDLIDDIDRVLAEHRSESPEGE